MLYSNKSPRSRGAGVVDIIHPSPQLCSSCASFPWPSGLTTTATFSKTFSSAQKSADEGCVLCRFVWSLIISNCEVISEVLDSEEFAKGSIELYVHEDKGVLILVPEVVQNGQVLSTGTGARLELVGCSDTEVMEKFETRHIKVDVGEGDDSLVKLIDVKSCDHIPSLAYLILSYCWGTGNESSKTTESNLNGRLRGFSVSELPKTIRDAILLTRMMGYRYLWVDAMCTIQGPSGDFHAESTRMGDYYSNAECCISASAATDSQQGFLTERPLARFPIEDIAFKIHKKPSRLWAYSGIGSNIHKEPVYSILKWNHNTTSAKKHILTSPLTERGWCLQETALAKRTLHWTLQGVFLECQTSLFLEGRKARWSYKGPLSEVFFSPRDILAMPDEDLLFSSGWYQLVIDFSETKLTYETDRLYAIHGLAPENVQLPSWCWASSCSVSFMKILQVPIYIRDDHPDRPTRFPTHPETISTVEGTTSRLYIRAPIIQLEIGALNVGYTKTSGSDDIAKFEYWYWLDSNRRVMRDYPAVSFVAEWVESSSVSWIPVGQSEGSLEYIVGLLVHEVPSQGEGVYCRYGLLAYKGQDDSILDDQRLNDVSEIALV
ncbi:uncharacterized protein FPRO_08940 [Fusarium proliferatum ET1]|uniref:Related to tol protein n=1 Tax=Fusarium proliferatum (strain ET1) TaxID=1227346 RepID=A0A1L7W9N9_FUSPR|nr:uncharacterized protein FPRO_08940 [Fusarium proliferatum ET1]CZR49320.1 related to tol protein [Fusarium proliferatum ET1]